MNFWVYIWIFVGVDILLVLAGIWWLVWAMFFDKRLRVTIHNAKGHVSMHKVNTKKDGTFTVNGGSYVIDKECIYRKFTRVPHSYYWENNPKPIKFSKDKGQAVYTAVEIHDLLNTNMTLNLIRPRPNITKLAMTMGIIIVFCVIVAVILHFMGVINLSEMLSGTPPVR